MRNPTKGHIEAFSDGLLAIVITILVLELKVPEGHDAEALCHLPPIFLSDVLSFSSACFHWNNRHQMFQAMKHAGGRVLWANLHLRFWLSRMPFAPGSWRKAALNPCPSPSLPLTC